MESTNVTLRVDTELKKQAEELFSDLGLSMSAAITVFMKQAVREQRIPFTVSRGYNGETIQAIENVRNRQNLSRGFSNVQELMEDLSADD
ncbi:MAG: type II toxin-antitoxin system RelB/DinJ family antitoxin [Lachnospiraceae bacterium]|nr:type II toxin-antitoxin system RelB/DinJ family antitoxin [Lachnospiraceae bacterium]